jgi:hypothetical protein
MLSDILDTISHALRKSVQPPKMEILVDGFKPFIAAFEAQYGPLIDDPKAKGNFFSGIPISESSLVLPGMAVIMQDGEVVDIIRYAPPGWVWDCDRCDETHKPDGAPVRSPETQKEPPTP